MNLTAILIIIIIAASFYAIGKIVKKLIKIPLLIILGLITLTAFYPSVEKINGMIQNMNIENIKFENKKMVFLGDSLTAGENSSGKFKDSTGKNIGYVQKLIDLNFRNNKNNQIINYAVSGFKTNDVIDQLNGDLVKSDSFKLNTEFMLKKGFTNEQDAIFKANPNNLIEDVKNADTIVVTIGSNDLLAKLENPVTKKVEVNLGSVQKIIDEVAQLRIDVVSKIQTLNANAKIIFLGSYVPYTDLNFTIAQVYELLMAYYDFTFENQLSTDQKKIVKNLIIRDNMFASPTKALDNPSNIHPSTIGYDYISNELIKKLNKELN